MKIKPKLLNPEEMKDVATILAAINYEKADCISRVFQNYDESGARTYLIEMYIGGHSFIFRHYDGYGGHECSLIRFDAQRLGDSNNFHGVPVDYEIIERMEKVYEDKFVSTAARETELKPVIEALKTVTTQNA